MHRNRAGEAASLVAALAVFCLGDAALAEPDAAFGLDQYMQLLDSEEYEQRELAQTNLVHDTEVAEEDIIAALRSEVTTEQRLRLMQALQQRFMSSLRGAIGIRFKDDPSRPTLISQLLENYPSGKSELAKGDEIIAVDGHRLPLQGESLVPSRMMLRSHTFSHEPGEQLRLLVRRPIEANNGEVRHEERAIVITLGAADPAKDFRISQGELREAFKVRLARLEVTTGVVDPLRVGVREESSWDTPKRHKRSSTRRGRVIVGPVYGEREGAGRTRPMAQSQREQRRIEALSRMLPKNNPQNLQAKLEERRLQDQALNVREVAAKAAVEIPDRAKKARVRNARAAQNVRMLTALRTPPPAVEAEPTEDPSNRMGELAIRITQIQAELERQTRLIMNKGANDASVQRVAQRHVDELRTELETLTAELGAWIGSDTTESGAEASVLELE